MRYDELNKAQKLDFLKRLHNHVNKEAFNSKLTEIEIEIGEFQQDDGTFADGYFECTENPRIIADSKIVISDKIPDNLTDEELHEHIVSVMVHEMCHQFQYENNLEMGHGAEFDNIAHEAGLDDEFTMVIWTDLLNVYYLSPNDAPIRAEEQEPQGAFRFLREQKD